VSLFCLSRYKHSDAEKNRVHVVQLPVIWGKSDVIENKQYGSIRGNSCACGLPLHESHSSSRGLFQNLYKSSFFVIEKMKCFLLPTVDECPVHSSTVNELMALNVRY
jgi:hypothetical protein